MGSKSVTKLINCRTCGQDVSSKAATCPHCGETLKRKQTPTGLVAATIIALLIAGIMYYLITS